MNHDARALLAALGDDGYLSVCWKAPGASKLDHAVADVPAVLASIDAIGDKADLWYGVNRMTVKPAAGRGRAADVTRVTCLYSDLDTGKALTPVSIEEARTIIDGLADPGYIVHSGHGLQPIWPLTGDEWDTSDPAQRAAVAQLVKRWGQMIADRAEARGWVTDNVYDLARILRVPGTVNHKVRGKPVRTRMEVTGGVPLTYDEVAELIAEHERSAPKPRKIRVEGKAARAAATTQAVRGWLDTGAGFQRPATPYGSKALEGLLAECDPTNRHPWMVRSVIRVVELTDGGDLDGHQALSTIRDKFTEVINGERPVVAEFADAVRHAVGQLVPAGTKEEETSKPEPEPVILAAAPRYPRESLVGPLRDFVDWAVRDGLHAETAGAAGLAALVSLTGPARLQLNMKEIRAILWIALIGIPSSGKSPAFEHAFARIRDAYAEKNNLYVLALEGWEASKNTDGTKPGPRPVRPQPLEFDDATPEAVARWLLARMTPDQDPSGAVIDDELAATLEGMNQYKGGMGSDRSKWLKLWTGADLSIMRVGKGGAQNEVHLYVRKPVVSLAGPLTDSNAHLMGKQGSGFRPRFLPHLAPAEPPAWNNAGPHPGAWNSCIDALLADRKPRTWNLQGAALAVWNSARDRWRRQQDEPEPDDVIEALRKADTQCCRIALVIAESLAPGKGGDVPVSAIECAVAIVDYVIGCWRALPGTNTMASSRADDVMNEMSARFLAWLDRRQKGTEGLPDGSAPRPRATRRDVQRWSHLKPAELTALIMEHGARYPGCVVSAGARDGEGKGAAGGKPTVYVYAPERAVFGVAATPNNPVNPTSSDDETAGQSQPHSVSRPATPNERDTESATPNDSPPGRETPPQERLDHD